MLKKPQAAPVRRIREVFNRSQEHLTRPPPPPPGPFPSPLEPRPRPRPLPPPPPPPSVSVNCNGSLSCRNRCQSLRTFLRQEALPCFCDVDCTYFKDCCADYDEYCHHDSTRTPPIQDNLVNQLNKNLWKCYSGHHTLSAIEGVWMIGSCPRSWPEDDVLYRCRNLSAANRITRENYRYLPAYTSNGRVYHNRFCAQCNGVSPSEMASFELSFSCAVRVPDNFSPSQRFDYLFSYCDSSKINWKAPVNAPRRYCVTLNTISRCADEDIRGRCINGSVGIVFISSMVGNYKNIYCAKCDRHSQFHCGPRETIAKSGFNPHPQPFSVVFDFKNGDSSGKKYIKVSCPTMLYYDHYLEMCRRGYNSLPSRSSVQEYEVFLWFRFASNTDFTSGNPIWKLNVSAMTVALGNFFRVNRSEIRKPHVLSASYFMFNLQFNIQRPSSTLQDNPYTRSRRQSTVQSASFEDILKWESPFDVSLFGLRLTLFKANTKIISCTNLQKYNRSEYNVLQDDPSAILIKATAEVLKAKQYYTNGTSANDSQAIFVCRLPQKSNCSRVYILINEGEFRVLMNKSIFVNAFKQVYDWSEYTWVNKSVLVCRNFSKHYYKVKTSPRHVAELRVLTVVCLSLSIIGLVFVLVTYSLFSELRTPPGINLMNLSVSILLAQLLWLLGSGQTDTPMACTVIAVILHYLFLVSFVWTSIIAFDTWRAFSAKGRRPLADSRSERMKHCLRHMAVGWLPAMAYVAICVLLDLNNFVTIGYTSRRCWIGNNWAILYFLAAPVAVSLTFNTVFYILTLKAIRATSTQARAASDHHDSKQNFGIYVRIATLLGFPWAFGFVAPFDLEVLWYPFIVITGLQGLYIACAFTLNKRARTLYKNRFTCIKHYNSVGTSGLDTKSTNKSILPTPTLVRNQFVETKL